MNEVLRYRYQDKMTLKEIERVPSRCASFRGYYEQYLSPSPIYHVGGAKFNRTWISSVEAEVVVDTLASTGY